MRNVLVAAKAAKISTFNPAAAHLLLSLDQAETAAQISEALDTYDQVISRRLTSR